MLEALVERRIIVRLALSRCDGGAENVAHVLLINIQSLRLGILAK